MRSTAQLPVVLLALLLPTRAALGYGYDKDKDPLLIAFRAAIEAARDEDFAEARAQAKAVRWQLDELKQKQDLGYDFARAFHTAHGERASTTGVIHTWVNLLYLAMRQKFVWNLKEKLADYHKAKARLDAAETYYHMALAGNVRRDDVTRRRRDRRARSRHEDIVAHFAKARNALGSPGLLGAGKRAPEPASFQRAIVRILGHLHAVFPGLHRPKPKKKPKKHSKKDE